MKPSITCFGALVAMLLNPTDARSHQATPALADQAAAALDHLRAALQRADWDRTEIESSNLVALGTEVIPLLAQEAKQPGAPRRYQEQMVHAIANIGKGGEDSTRALLDLTLTASNANVSA